MAASPGASDGNGLSILEAVNGLGVKAVFQVDPTDEESTLATLRKAKAGSGANVVISSAPCVVYDKRSGGGETRAPLSIDQELCNQCALCVLVLGCPAIEVIDGRYEIVADLCDGCELCAFVCNQGAIIGGGE